MANYKDSEKCIFMDTGNHKEWITLYMNFKKPPIDKCPGIRLTRKMAWALMKEIEARLFFGNEKDIRLDDTLTAHETDYCFE